MLARFVLAILFFLAMLGCDSDDPTGPDPNPEPDLLDLDEDGHDDRDMQFLLDLLVNNPSLDIGPLDLGVQVWEKGRLVDLEIENEVYGDRSLGGPLPGSIGFLTEVRELSLAIHSFNGTIPGSIGNLENVETLALFGCNLTGPIPEEIAHLPRLQDLRLSANHLTGQIPEALAQKPLRVLALGSNQLTGTLPEFNPTNLTSLVLRNNGFSGDPLPLLVPLRKLEYLDLSGNDFTGEIPVELVQGDRRWQGFNLAQNRFSGTIPVDVCNDELRWIIMASGPEYRNALDANEFCPPWPACFDTEDIEGQACGGTGD